MGKKAERSERSLLYRLDHPSRRELCVRDLSRRASRWVSEGLGAGSGGIRPCDWLPHSVSSGVRLEVWGGACEVLRSPPPRDPPSFSSDSCSCSSQFFFFSTSLHLRPPSTHLLSISWSFSPSLFPQACHRHSLPSTFAHHRSPPPHPSCPYLPFHRVSPHARLVFLFVACPHRPPTQSPRKLPGAGRNWFWAHLFTLQPARRTPPDTRPGQPHPLDGAFPLTHRHKTSCITPRSESFLPPLARSSQLSLSLSV